MITAVLAGVAVWCFVPGSPAARQRALFGGREAPTRMNTALVAALLTPVAAIVVLYVKEAGRLLREAHTRRGGHGQSDDE